MGLEHLGYFEHLRNRTHSINGIRITFSYDLIQLDPARIVILITAGAHNTPVAVHSFYIIVYQIPITYEYISETVVSGIPWIVVGGLEIVGIFYGAFWNAVRAMNRRLEITGTF